VTEACYLVGKYLGPDAEINLVEAIAARRPHPAPLDIVGADLSRMAELMRRTEASRSASPTRRSLRLPSG
jgi:hypothetical protein